VGRAGVSGRSPLVTGDDEPEANLDDEDAMGNQTLEDRGPTVFVVSLILIILATVFVILRIISKWGVTRKANADDYFTIVAWLLALGLAVSIMIGTTVGLGSPDSRKPSSINRLKGDSGASSKLPEENWEAVSGAKARDEIVEALFGPPLSAGSHGGALTA
jgi:hypothetical protein